MEKLKIESFGFEKIDPLFDWLKREVPVFVCENSAFEGFLTSVFAYVFGSWKMPNPELDLPLLANNSSALFIPNFLDYRIEYISGFYYFSPSSFACAVLSDFGASELNPLLVNRKLTFFDYPGPYDDD